MKLRFIGQDGSLGFRRGQVYDLSFNAHRGRVYITSPVHCPYDSAAAFWRNWALDLAPRVNEPPRPSGGTVLS